MGWSSVRLVIFSKSFFFWWVLSRKIDPPLVDPPCLIPLDPPLDDPPLLYSRSPLVRGGGEAPLDMGVELQMM